MFIASFKNRFSPGHPKRTALARPAFAAGALLLVAVGCATGPRTPQLGSGESFDGLREVTNARVSKAWIRPDLDLSRYSKILPVNAGVDYRPVKATPRSAASSASAFPMSAETRARFEALVTEIFREELAKVERFTIATEPGPDVLVVAGGLLDVVSNVPPETIGRGEIYLSQVGEATLVVELRDSESNAALARIIDRRAAEKASGMTWSNTVSNTAEVRKLVRQWASRLRNALDTVPLLTEADD